MTLTSNIDRVCKKSLDVLKSFRLKKGELSVFYKKCNRSRFAITNPKIIRRPKGVSLSETPLFKPKDVIKFLGG